MHIYAYNNPYNDMGQISSSIVTIGRFAGKQFDAMYNALEVIRKNENDEDIMVRESDDEKSLIQIVSSDDVIITSTLTNFSVDFISALQTVAEFDAKNVRISAYQEDFDSANLRERVLIESLPMMHKFRRNAFEAKRKNRIAGIKKAVSEGKYKGRQPYSLTDFPAFIELYDKYMSRKINKREFAETLGVSRPTLDKLLDDFTKKKGNDDYE